MSDTMVCLGCGNTWSDERLAAEKRADPKIMSCCPERKMMNFDRLYRLVNEAVMDYGERMPKDWLKNARETIGGGK